MPLRHRISAHKDEGKRRNGHDEHHLEQRAADLGVQLAAVDALVRERDDDALAAAQEVAPDVGLDQQLGLGLVVEEDAVTEGGKVEGSVWGDGSGILCVYVLIERCNQGRVIHECRRGRSIL